MPRLSQAQQRARQAISEAGAAGYVPAVLARRIMEALTAAIPVDGFRLFGVDPRTLLINRLLCASDSDAWARAEWLRDVYLRAGELGYVELPVLMRSGLIAVAFHEHLETCWGYPSEVLERVDAARHRELFHEQRSPVGGSLLACFPVDGRWVAALQAYRREPERPFRAGDVAFLRLLAPAIGKAIGAALAREEASAPADDAERPSGILIVDRDGALRFATPEGEAWCRRIIEARQTEQGPIPTAVWASIAKLKGEGGAAAQVVAPSRGGLVRIEASPAGADGSIAVVLTPVRPAAALESPPTWPLTSAERRVVDRALRGEKNAEIAEALFLSVNTIEWHLRSAYGKLGVDSRTGLLARLFAELAPPELVNPAPAETSRTLATLRP